MEMTHKEYKITIYKAGKKVKNEIKGEQGTKTTKKTRQT